MFLKDASEDRESRINFTEISRSLPPILFRMGKKIDDESLARFAASWDSRRKEYESYLADLESQADDEDDFDEPVVKPEKSKMPGQQNAQAEQIVNDILSKLPKNVAGDIRNAIARAPNKLQALHQELTKRKIQAVAEGSNDTIYPNAEVIKSKNGKPVGEIYQDGNSWGAFHYKADRGYDFIDSREEAIEALKDLHQETGRSRPDYTIKGVAE